MSRSVQAQTTAAIQWFVMFKPVIRVWYGRVGHAKHMTLRLKRVPQEFVILLKANAGIRAFPNHTSSEKMVQMGVGVHERDNT